MPRHAALLLVVVLACAACAAGSTEEELGGFVRGDGAVTWIPEAEREPAPAVSAPTLAGDPLELADFEGGPVLVNFWASWCGPCAREAPHLVAIADEYADRGVYVVGVNVRDSVVNARSFERDHGIDYPSWHDEAASVAAAFGGIGPAALPSTILLDDQHRVAVRIFGAVTAAQLSAQLGELLDEADGQRATADPPGP